MKKYKLKFEEYIRPDGKNEVREFYGSLPLKDLAKLKATIYNIEEHGLYISERMEWVKKIDNDLYEVRSKLGSNIQRVLYFHIINNKYMLTNGFTKKTGKTPPRVIEHAKLLRREYKEIVERENINEK
ncbi:type II toxin-antitoxin system RelE/ParE family toxin [Companilactobacillus halodurans]|uniref:Type II toxin-antitoxin system RelE/ParE family toxin n=1 Tax=Companilactobacillus halodurans TaxID=2584183 RepID=A0A5P0ZP48_9LACO|nr:type II toxin-antitoxin system RelE/ParE family toxin [Companilactobacillus halodurans]MQS75976.1 type II toxin-antitoxin system RelE/ParE family toxin [Companilactobacillus halodurans]MQS96411.1 type II toxin-antitoxin system RelE/ParE family toxin [Companilactobacillus halodurans]